MIFLDLQKLAKRYNFSHVYTEHGSYSVALPRLGDRGVWVGIHCGMLHAGSQIVNSDNEWLDALASDVANGRVTEREFV